MIKNEIFLNEKFRFKYLANKICYDDLTTRATRANANKKFFKFQEVFDYIKSKLVNSFEPGENLCVDETLNAFRGRCSFRQYMPNKPNKYGIKLWTLVCNKTGIVCDVDVYLGKSSNNDASLSIGENVKLFNFL